MQHGADAGSITDEQPQVERGTSECRKGEGLASFQDAVFLRWSSMGVAPINPWLLFCDAFGIWMNLRLMKPDIPDITPSLRRRLADSLLRVISQAG